MTALARGDEVLRAIAGDSANPNLLGVDAAAAVIVNCVERVLDGQAPAAIGAGVAGAADERIRERLRAVLNERFPAARIAVTHDARIALRAAVPEGDGLVLIAGTGSIAYAEIGGEAFRAGGYGYLLGDAGSGYAIGSQAVRQLLTGVESGLSVGSFFADLASHIGADEPSAVLARLYRSATPVADVAACAPIVLRHAAAGDDLATAIVRRAVEGLYDLMDRIVRRHATSALRVALSGGLLQDRNAIADGLEQRIAASALDVSLVEARVQPFVGALAQARRLVALS